MSQLTDSLFPESSGRVPQYGHFSGARLTINWFAAAALVCGAATPLVVNIMGELYVGELLLIQFAFLLLLMRGATPLMALPTLGIFLQTAVLMLLGYFVSDIYRDAHPAQFLRGWAKIILVTLDFLALAVVVAHDRRNLWWFILGMAIGGLCDLMVREIPISTVSGWKSGYSLPLVTALACLCCFFPVRLAAAGFVAMGIGNMVMDFRILGAICIFIGAILWLRSDGAAVVSGRRLLRVFAACTVAVGVTGSVMLLTQDEFSVRREQSNAGRGAGLSVGVRAIADSPIIGYGSWPMDARLVNLFHQKVEEFGGVPEGTRKINTFHAHSQILQGWVEGGVLGALFWFYYGYWLIRAGWYVLLHRPADAFLPLFLFFLIYDLWHLFMSPFVGPTRFPIAIGIAIICICAAEMRSHRELTCASSRS